MLFVIWMSMFPLIKAPPTLAPMVRPTYNIAYKEVDGKPILLDIFQPASQNGLLPAVVIVHGGLWIVNDKSQYRDFALGLARSDFVSVCIDFRKNPNDGFIAQVTDIKDAIRWVRLHAADYGIDPNRIGIFGSSSGGHLAAMAAMAGNGEGIDDDPPGTSSAVQSAFYLYGVYHLKPDTTSPLNPLLARYTGAKSPVDKAAYDKWSPINYVNGNEPPTMMVHGMRDKVAPLLVAEEVENLMEDRGESATVFPWPDKAHGFAELQPWSRPLIFYLVQTFFESTL